MPGLSEHTVIVSQYLHSHSLPECRNISRFPENVNRKSPLWLEMFVWKENFKVTRVFTIPPAYQKCPNCVLITLWRKPVLGTQIQLCLVLIKLHVMFPVSSNWSGAEDTRIHHKCYPEGNPLSILVSAGGEEAAANLQNTREG